MAAAPIISLLNLLSGVVALAISYYAYKNNKLVGSILLRYISVGFLLLGIRVCSCRRDGDPLEADRSERIPHAQGLELILPHLHAAPADSLRGLRVGIRAQRVSEEAGALTRAVRALIGVLALGRSLARAVLVLAVYVASQVADHRAASSHIIQGVRVFSHSKSNLALMVLFGFSLIFVGHLLMLGGSTRSPTPSTSWATPSSSADSSRCSSSLSGVVALSSERPRSALKIYLDILVTVRDEGNTKPTRILYRANLSHDRLVKYLGELSWKGAARGEAGAGRQVLHPHPEGPGVHQPGQEGRGLRHGFRARHIGPNVILRELKFLGG